MAGPAETDVLEPGPLDLARALELLAERPDGVATTLLDAALAGPVVLHGPGPRAPRGLDRLDLLRASARHRRAAHVLHRPRRPDRARQRATPRPQARSTRRSPPRRNPASTRGWRSNSRTAATSAPPSPALEEADGVALAVHSGATHLLAPEHLPRALELITDLVRCADRSPRRPAPRAPYPGPPPRSSRRRAVPSPVVIDEVEPEPLDAEVVEESERSSSSYA